MVAATEKSSLFFFATIEVCIEVIIRSTASLYSFNHSEILLFFAQPPDTSLTGADSLLLHLRWWQ